MPNFLAIVTVQAENKEQVMDILKNHPTSSLAQIEIVEEIQSGSGIIHKFKESLTNKS